ncbi:hypothetical protein GCM10019059_29300 [Camelimonas fluminis]|uniref:hypothetical protein n=1 Tax=Camelimonas fluminis TaxID=1576911 RepID=UPI00174DEBAF|nr:hypothetical protein [Camelimonas fluminis]GHE67694.1 hypothetical protein GCM10019059_29300 [Camelimonas fluminis]
MRPHGSALAKPPDIAGHRRFRTLFALVLAYALALQPLLMGGGIAHGAPGDFQALCAAGSAGRDDARPGDAPPAGAVALACCCLAAIGGAAAEPPPPLALPGAPPFARLAAPAVADWHDGWPAPARPSARPRAPPAHPEITQTA